MGYVTTIFIKPKKAALIRAFNGRFVMDHKGKMICSTLPSAMPEGQVNAITETVLTLFNSAFKAGLQLTTFVVSYAGLDLHATSSQARTHVFLKSKSDQATPVEELNPVATDQPLPG